MTEDLLKDFDILSPPKRVAKIGGEEIDVTIIPARAALKFIDFSKKYNVKALENTTAESFDSAMLEGMLDVVALVCKKSSSKITAEWLLDNVEIQILMQFVQYVFAGLKKKDEVEAGEDGKN